MTLFGFPVEIRPDAPTGKIVLSPDIARAIQEQGHVVAVQPQSPDDQIIETCPV